MKTSITLFLLLAAATAQASPTVQSLKDEPTTLFDLGMLRLELSIAHSQESVESLYSRHAQADPIASWASVSYSVRDDMIRVGAGLWTSVLLRSRWRPVVARYCVCGASM